MDFGVSQTLPNKMMYGSLRPPPSAQNIPKLDLNSFSEDTRDQTPERSPDDLHFASVREEHLLGQRNSTSPHSSQSLYVKLHDDTGKTVRRFNLRKMRRKNEEEREESKERDTVRAGTSILETMETYLRNEPGARAVRFLDSRTSIITSDSQPQIDEKDDDDESIDDDGFEQ